MADSVISPNMNLPIPVVGQAPGPSWADLYDQCLALVDAHSHASGQGVQITPDGININADLTFNQTANATNVRSVRFYPQTSTIPASGLDLGCMYEVNADLYYNDGSGNQIRITQGGSLAGASGTITGLPSGTASAAYASSSGSFIFQQATSTGANLDVASIAIRYPGSYPTPSGNYVQLQAPVGLATGYAFTLPAATPALSGAWLTSDTSGLLSYTNVDNSTVEISSSVLRVKDAGITSAKLAAGAVVTASISAGAVTATGLATDAVTTVKVLDSNITQPKLYTRAFQTGAATAGNVSYDALSSSNNTSSSTYVDVGLICTLDVTGRPVLVEVIPKITGGVFSLGSTGVNTGRIRVTQNGSSIGETTFGGGSVPVFPILKFWAVPSAGTYVYRLQFLAVGGAGVVTISNAGMVAYELN